MRVERLAGPLWVRLLQPILMWPLVGRPGVRKALVNIKRSVEAKFVRSAPDLVVEVSSPSTRRLELVRKRELYERYAVPEYWYVDLDADRVEVYRLRDGRYGTPALLGSGEVIESPNLPGLSVPVGELLAASAAP